MEKWGETFFSLSLGENFIPYMENLNVELMKLKYA